VEKLSKPGAPKGSANARKGAQSATEHLHIRCTAQQKKRWKQAAKQAGKKLSQWVLSRLPFI
jgi:uncharacterized protein (DUF1778 family)